MLQLVCASQPYQWGKIGAESIIFQLLKSAWPNQQLDPKLTYAELWMGTHPSGPSLACQSDGKQVPLTQVLNNSQLPFLFKVLSVQTALSIQVHPDKENAEALYIQFPDIYKDNNYKPEMAIALTEFEALSNFCTKDEIINNIQFLESVGLKLQSFDQFCQCSENNGKELLKQMVTQLLDLSDENLRIICDNLMSKIKAIPAKSLRDVLTLKLFSQYGVDIGILYAYLLNHVFLQPGECLTMDPHEPHAYIQGDCIECMACSDNVIRAGLTPKFKDKKTLIQLQTYEMKKPQKAIKELIIKQENLKLSKYPSNYKEFECWLLEDDCNYISQYQQKQQINSLHYSFKTCTIMLVIQGQGVIKQYDQKQQIKGDIQEIQFKNGTVVFLQQNFEFEISVCENHVKIYFCCSKE